MNWYADFAPRRARQIVADAAALTVVILAIIAGVVVRNTIAALGGVFVNLQAAGAGFEGTMGEIGERLGGVPLIGDGIRGPFDQAAGAGVAISDAGRTGQTVVESIATMAGLGFVLVPLAVVLLAWLWPRIRFARRAGETRALLQLQDGEQLLALRALDGARAGDLARISPRVVTAWRAGDPEVVRALAALEARGSGVRLPRLA
ncbi:MAG TPA: hypothetical protein VL043_04045 [Protaetiibacter sp.]|nr:hypothetical protein [Protaetiibacter sp.]